MQLNFVSIKYALFLMAVVVAVAASSPRKCGESDPIPDTGFADLAALEQWSKSSSFGGGDTQKLTLGSQEIYCTYRQVTSGISSTELVFWKQMNGRVVPCLIMPVREGAYSVIVVGDEIVMRYHFRSDTNLIEIMRVKPEFFTAGSFFASLRK